MTKFYDGGPAFPVPPDSYSSDGVMMIPNHAHQGMSLRDHLAGLAMQGILSGKASNMALWDDITEQMTANQAYAFADAMLKERDKPPATPTTL